MASGRAECLLLLFVLIISAGCCLPESSVAQVGPDSSYVRPVYERGDAQLRLVTTTGLLGATQGALVATSGFSPSGSFDDFNDYILTLFGGMTLGGAAGTIVPLIATQNTTVRRDAATLTGFGGIQGYAHASELILLIGGDDGVPVTSGALLVAGVGAAEAATGYLVGQRWNAYAGTSEMLAVTGAAGHLIGYGAVRGIGQPRVDPATDEDERLYASGALVGSLLGMWVGYRIGQTGEYTTGDARLYATTGLIGAGMGLSASQLSQGENARRNVAVSATGAVIGLGTGAVLGHAYDFTPSEGNVIASAGFLTGSLFGAISQAAFEGVDGEESPEGNLFMTSLGTAVGAAVSIAFLGSDARERSKNRQNPGDLSGETSSNVRLDVNVSPYVPVGPMPPNAPRTGLRPMLNVSLSF